MEERISQLHAAALAGIEAAASLEALEAVRVEALGRKGKLAEISKEFGRLTPDQRSSLGKLLNSTKQDLEARLDARKAVFETAALNTRLDAEWLDLTIPAPGVRPGSIHPVTQIQSEIEELFVSLGFAVLDGPEVETEYNNFDALNIPADHPARDMQ